MDLVCSCGHHIKNTEVWILKDIKNFDSRKLIIGHCKCNKLKLALIERRLSDKKIFTNIIEDKYTSKILLNEKNRLVCRYYDVKSSSLYGWIYGVNIEIKNKQGKVTQIRQYSADFNGNKEIQRKMKV